MNASVSVPIGEYVEAVEKWNPKEDCKSGTFRYVDLSSVDQEKKTVLLNGEVAASEAPSRARQLLQNGDVLVSTVRPNLNGVAYVTTDLDGATGSTGFCVLRPNPRKLCGRYLFHWVQTPQFIAEMTRNATGQSYPAVSDRIVKDSLIPLPPLKEQRRIAAVLDQADALRRLRQRAIARLNDLEQSIFYEMFGDPVANPKRHRTGVLGDVIHSASDGPHVSPEYVEEGIPFLSTRHVRQREIVWKDLKYISSEEADRQWKKCKPERGDILYTKGGTTGIAALVDVEIDFAVWVHVALLKPQTEVVNPVWLTSMLNSQYCYHQSQLLTHGIANRDLGLKRMVKIKLFIPTLAEQEKFAGAMAQLNKARKAAEKGLAREDELFSSLQNRAFSGAL